MRAALILSVALVHGQLALADEHSPPAYDPNGAPTIQPVNPYAAQPAPVQGYADAAPTVQPDNPYAAQPVPAPAPAYPVTYAAAAPWTPEMHLRAAAQQLQEAGLKKEAAEVVRQADHLLLTEKKKQLKNLQAEIDKLEQPGAAPKPDQPQAPPPPAAQPEAKKARIGALLRIVEIASTNQLESLCGSKPPQGYWVAKDLDDLCAGGKVSGPESLRMIVVSDNSKPHDKIFNSIGDGSARIVYEEQLHGTSGEDDETYFGGVVPAVDFKTAANPGCGKFGTVLRLTPTHVDGREFQIDLSARCLTAAEVEAVEHPDKAPNAAAQKPAEDIKGRLTIMTGQTAIISGLVRPRPAENACSAKTSKPDGTSAEACPKTELLLLIETDAWECWNPAANVGQLQY